MTKENSKEKGQQLYDKWREKSESFIAMIQDRHVQDLFVAFFMILDRDYNTLLFENLPLISFLAQKLENYLTSTEQLLFAELILIYNLLFVEKLLSAEEWKDMADLRFLNEIAERESWIIQEFFAFKEKQKTEKTEKRKIKVFVGVVE